MRFIAILPILCCTVALILSFLCLFAGHKKDFMEDYHLLTLNTSRLGTTLFDTTSDPSSNPLTNLIHNISNTVQNDLNNLAGSVAESLGIDDFYSAHILDYCYGDYTPTTVPNASFPASHIHKNVTACSNQTAMYAFNPTQILERALNESGVDVSLEDLHWPDDIDRSIDALRTVFKTVFVLYCIAIGLIFVALVASVPAALSAGRLAACLNVMLTILAFLAIGLASALVTAVVVKGADALNKYGADIGVQAQKGSKFLAITWSATALMFVALCAWSFETCFGHRRRRETTYVAKQG